MFLVSSASSRPRSMLIRPPVLQGMRVYWSMYVSFVLLHSETDPSEISGTEEGNTSAEGTLRSVTSRRGGGKGTCQGSCPAACAAKFWKGTVGVKYWTSSGCTRERRRCRCEWTFVLCTFLLFLNLYSYFNPGIARGTKRKFDFDHDKAEVMAREAEEIALRQIEVEQVPTPYIYYYRYFYWLTRISVGRSSKIEVAWLLASVINTNRRSWTAEGSQAHHYVSSRDSCPPTGVRLQTFACIISLTFHKNRLKNLISVSFSSLDSNGESDAKSDNSNSICPSCKKGLSNNLILFRQSASFTSLDTTHCRFFSPSDEDVLPRCLQDLHRVSSAVCSAMCCLWP